MQKFPINESAAFAKRITKYFPNDLKPIVLCEYRCMKFD